MSRLEHLRLRQRTLKPLLELLSTSEVLLRNEYDMRYDMRPHIIYHTSFINMVIGEWLLLTGNRISHIF